MYYSRVNIIDIWSLTCASVAYQWCSDVMSARSGSIFLFLVGFGWLEGLVTH